MGYYASFPVKANTQPCDDQVEVILFSFQFFD